MCNEVDNEEEDLFTFSKSGSIENDVVQIVDNLERI